MFSGNTFNQEQDGARLTGQLGRVAAVMADGDWHTLAELAQKCGGSEAAISARIRDFRKPKFGAMEVTTERVRAGLWRYKLVAA